MSRRSLAFGLCFLLICSAIVPITVGFNVKVSRTEQPSNIGNGKTLYVGGSGPDNYTTIQSALNHADDGDTVYVYNDSSPYYENIMIRSRINLTGEDRNTTVIEAYEYYPVYTVIYIRSEEVSISGFTISGNPDDPSKYWGIYASESMGPAWKGIVFNNIFINTAYGIVLSSHNYSIFNNIFLNNIVGICVILGDHNLIYKNEIYNCETGLSIWEFSTYNYFYENIIRNNHKGINIDEGRYGDVKYNRIYSNEILYNHVGVSIESSSNEGVIYNYFFGNNFIGNIESNACFTDKPSPNCWNEKCFGNFWDDYTGEDNDGNGIGDTPYIIQKSLFITNQDNYPRMEPFGDFNPNAPDAPEINGSTNPEPEVEYEYTFITTDPNGDNVFYYISWGDGTFEEWIGPFDSSEEVIRSHTWKSKKNRVITAQAMDTNGLVGCWGTLPIIMPRNRATYNSLFLQLLELFPILKEVILRLIR